MGAAQIPRMILLSLIGMLLMLLVWVLSVGIERRDVFPSSRGLITEADIEMDWFALKQIRGGLVEWDIHAKRAELFENRHAVLLNNLDAILQTDEGLRVSFAGDRGLLNTQSRDFEIRKDDGDLDVSMNNGYSVQARSLAWKDRTREIVSEQPVRIFGQGFRIQGDQLTIRLENQEFSVVGDVHVTQDP